MKLPTYQRQRTSATASTNLPTMQGVPTSSAVVSAIGNNPNAKGLDALAKGLMTVSNTVSEIGNDIYDTNARDAANKMAQDFSKWQGEQQKKLGKHGMNSAEEYQAWQENELKTLTKDMNDIERGRFERIAKEQGSRFSFWAEGHGHQQKTAYQIGTLEATIETQAELLTKNINNPAMAQMSIAQIGVSAREIANMKGWGKEQTELYEKKALQSALVPAIELQIAEGRLGAASALMKHHAPALGAKSVAVLQKQIKSEQKRMASEARARAREAEYQRHVNNAHVLNDAQSAMAMYKAGQVPKKVPSLEELKLALPEKKALKVHQELIFFGNLQENVQNMYTMNPTQLGDFLTKAKPSNQDTFIEDAESFKVYTQTAKNILDQREKEPIRYTLAHNKALQETRNVFFENMSEENARAYFTALEVAKKDLGIDSEKLFTAEESNFFAQMLTKSDNPLQATRNLHSTLGAYAPTVYAQLTKDNKLTNDFQIKAQMTSEQAASALTAAQQNPTFNEDFKKTQSGVTDKDVQTKVIEELADLGGTFSATGHANIAGIIHDNVATLAKHYIMQGMEADDAVELASEQVITEQYNVYEKVRIPTSLDANRIAKGHDATLVNLEEAPEKMLSQMFKDKKFSSSDKEVLDLKRAIGHGATFVTNNDESGVVLFYGIKPASIGEGDNKRLIQFTWEELYNMKYHDEPEHSGYQPIKPVQPIYN